MNNLQLMDMEERKRRPEGGCLIVMALLVQVVFFISAVVFLVHLFCGCTDRDLRKEVRELREELVRAQQYVPMKRDTIRDTVEVVTQKIVEVEKVKNVLTKEDRQLLRDIGVKVKELEQMQKIGMATLDTVSLSPTRREGRFRASVSRCVG